MPGNRFRSEVASRKRLGPGQQMDGRRIGGRQKNEERLNGKRGEQTGEDRRGVRFGLIQVAGATLRTSGWKES